MALNFCPNHKLIYLKLVINILLFIPINFLVYLWHQNILFSDCVIGFVNQPIDINFIFLSGNIIEFIWSNTKINHYLFLINMEQLFDFTVTDLASKWWSKTEIYNVLTRDAKLYFPPIKDCTQKFARAIMRGD